jgi:hypothetical protein
MVSEHQDSKVLYFIADLSYIGILYIRYNNDCRHLRSSVSLQTLSMIVIKPSYESPIAR